MILKELDPFLGGSQDEIAHRIAQDRMAYHLRRYFGKSGEVDLEHLRWGNFDLLVIDESHNFRNKSTDSEKKDRYTRLIDFVYSMADSELLKTRLKCRMATCESTVARAVCRARS